MRNGEVKIRRAAASIATFFVAICVALAVPVSQVRLVTTIASCCCPDPSHCHCPPEKPDSEMPTMKTCHHRSHDIVSPSAPLFVYGTEHATDRAPSVIEVAVVLRTERHDTLDPRRPDAPS
ncbi:MAG TPA: hypothetical protein VGG74_29280 [Kofleriaceae bacterium]